MWPHWYERRGGGDHVAADAMRGVRSVVRKFFSALVLVSIFSAANGVMLTAPRLYYSMARDGVFFARWRA
jgi:APA family basic amino acid/polyamine antiporter